MDVGACLVRQAQHAGHVVRTSDSFHCGTSGGHAVVGRNFNKSFRKGPSSSLVVLPQANFCSKDVRGICNYGLLNRQQLSDGQIVEGSSVPHRGVVFVAAKQSQGWRSKSTTSRVLVRCAVGNGAVSNGATNEVLVDAAKLAQSENIRALLGETTPVADQLFLSDQECDPDSPSAGFSSISEAVEAIKQGKVVVVVDDEDRENEGDLIMAAEVMTPEAMAFFVQHTTGIVCAGVKGEILDRLQIPLMVPDKDNEEALLTAFTVTVDVKAGTSTGVSAKDRCLTVKALASSDSKPNHFRRPGHVFPLRYREGGVLKRAGHTEASVDLAVMAGFAPVGVLCELVNNDGSMSRLPDLQKFAKAYDCPLISIADLIRYKRKRAKLVTRTAVARLPTTWGSFQAYSYRSELDGIEHLALVKGNIGNGLDVLVRVHSECLTGDIFGSARCDCGTQLAEAMARINDKGRGVVVYLRGHEGRGIGLGHKLQAYNLQDAGRDTVEANVDLGLPIDSREYGIGAQILLDLGVKTMNLMTNNPAKYSGLRGYGLAITHRIPVISPVTKENRRYLETKRTKMGHVYGPDLQGIFSAGGIDDELNKPEAR